MKKTLITLAALVACSTSALSDTIKADEAFYTNAKGGWLYVWTGAGSDTSAGNYANWNYYENAGTTNPSSSSGNLPGAKAQTFIGWDVTSDNNTKVLQSNNKEYTVELTEKTWWLGDAGATGKWYLGTNVKLTGTNLGIGNSQASKNNFGFYFADLGNSNSLVSFTQLWIRDTDITIEGTLTMTDSTFEKVLLSCSDVKQNEGNWDASGFNVTDASGQSLAYAESGSDNIGKAGYYWLEVVNSDNSLTVTLAAQATPEPTTATLSLLALAGLCARRRRK